MALHILSRHDELATWQSVNPIVPRGELAISFVGNTPTFRMGDGVTRFNSLSTFSNDAVITALLNAHLTATDPHSQYITQAELTAALSSLGGGTPLPLYSINELVASTAQVAGTVTVEFDGLIKDVVRISMDQNFTLQVTGEVANGYMAAPLIVIKNNSASARVLTIGDSVKLLTGVQRTITLQPGHRYDISISKLHGDSIYAGTILGAFVSQTSATTGTWVGQIALATDRAWFTATGSGLGFTGNSWLDTNEAITNAFVFTKSVGPDIPANTTPSSVKLKLIASYAAANTNRGTTFFAEKGSNPATFSNLANVNGRTLTTINDGYSTTSWPSTDVPVTIDIDPNVIREVTQHASYLPTHKIAIIAKNSLAGGDLAYKWTGLTSIQLEVTF
jgi:hypothetical protein